MGIFKNKNKNKDNKINACDIVECDINKNDSGQLNNDDNTVNDEITVNEIKEKLNREKLNSIEPEILEKHIEKYGDSFLVEYYDKDKGLFDKYVLTATNKGKNIPVSKYNENGVFFLNWSTHYIGGFQNNIIPMYELISKDTILGFMELMVDTHDEFVGRMAELVKKWECDEVQRKLKEIDGENKVNEEDLKNG